MHIFQSYCGSWFTNIFPHQSPAQPFLFSIFLLSLHNQTLIVFNNNELQILISTSNQKTTYLTTHPYTHFQPPPLHSILQIRPQLPPPHPINSQPIFHQTLHDEKEKKVKQGEKCREKIRESGCEVQLPEQKGGEKGEESDGEIEWRLGRLQEGREGNIAGGDRIAHNKREWRGGEGEKRKEDNELSIYELIV